jgi:methionyl-tRNA synthetase
MRGNQGPHGLAAPTSTARRSWCGGREGVDAAETADRYNRLIVEDLQPRAVLRPVHPDHDGNHYASVQEIFTGCSTNGYVFPQTTPGAISPSTGRTLPDRYIEGTCPICGYDGARGDQCDNCGNQLDPTDLINPRQPINGETPKFVETEHYFLDLPAFAERSGLAASRDDWRPERAAVLAQPARRPQAAGDHPRHRLGRAGAAGRLAGPPDKRSTSGSTR